MGFDVGWPEVMPLQPLHVYQYTLIGLQPSSWDRVPSHEDEIEFLKLYTP